MAGSSGVGFQSLFEEVVKAKRLSSSKMAKLTEVALKNMENDTQMVSIMFRTHKSLSVQGKISSLYTFDALSRAAREAIDKKKVEADPHSSIGNCATFLSKLENVLESLFQDLIATKSPELKEKSKKILDIWTKHHTFPESVLRSLSGLLTAPKKEPPQSATPPAANTRPSLPNHQAPSASATPVDLSSASNIQSALLALLGQNTPGAVKPDAIANSSQTSGPVTTPNNPLMDAAQLALLQTLAQRAMSGQNRVVQQQQQFQPQPQPPAGTSHMRSPPPFASSPNHNQFPHADQYRNNERGERGWRGRGRGGYGGGGGGSRYESPPVRERRSRSRSPPPRHPTRNNSQPDRLPRPFSPRGRSPPGGGPQAHVVPAASDSGLDEFGRVIRQGSPSSVIESNANSSSNTPAQGHDQDKPVTGSAHSATPPPPPPQPPQTQPIQSVLTQTESKGPTGRAGLESINLATFDPASPSSWQQLGDAWQVSKGYAPSQEFLMAYVMSGGNEEMATVMAASMGGPSNGNAAQNGYNSQGSSSGGYMGGQDQSAYQNPGRGRGRGRGGQNGGFSGRGGYENQNQAGEWGNANAGGYGGYQSMTDAVVLGGGDVDSSQSYDNSYEEGNYSGYSNQNDGQGNWEGYDTSTHPKNEIFSNGVQELPNAVSLNTGDRIEGGGNSQSSGGKMQRVGDRWVWQPAS